MRHTITISAALFAASFTLGCEKSGSDSASDSETKLEAKSETKAGGPPGGGGGGGDSACGTCSDATPSVPVVLVHGRNDTSARWDALVSSWSSRGYTENTNLFRIDMTTDCGDNGYCSQLSGYSGASVNESYAMCLKAYIDSKVPTGQVDLVTHSQGGITARYYSRFLDTSKVRKMVLMSGPQQGTNNCALAGSCTGINPETCPDSDVLRKLNGVAPQGDGTNDETPGEIGYAVVMSDKDNVIQGWCSGDLVLNPDQKQSDDVSCKGPSQFTPDPQAQRCTVSAQHLVIPSNQSAMDFAYCELN